MLSGPIDTSFDFRSDTPEGGDPDALSPTLRQYHQALWSKPLPTGGSFTLVDTQRGRYLHHRSDRGEHWMTSDTVVPTYRAWTRFGLPGIVAQLPEAELDVFQRLTFTMGGMMLFPSWTGVRHWSINQARGMLPQIADRIDLTVECIRRHYAGIDSPMSDHLAHYTPFFDLFGAFDHYVGFFLLDDLLTDDRAEVRFFLPFDDFARRAAVPASSAEYAAYQSAAVAFITARNARIDEWCGA